jgi:hypothetical protein
VIFREGLQGVLNAKVKVSVSANDNGKDNGKDNDNDNDRAKVKGKGKGKGNGNGKDVHAARHIEDGTGACLAGSRMPMARSG